MEYDNLDNKLELKKFKSFSEVNRNNTNIFIFKVEENFHVINSLYNNYLSTDEILKANRFLKLSDKNLYIVGKYRTREMLAHYLEIEPKSVIFNFNNNKKPEVQGLHHNISHSGSLCVLAISTSEVGIDIEKINDDFDFENVLYNTFSESEIEYINSKKELSRRRFYSLWCRKESLLKATGEGLTDNLNLINTLPNYVERHGNNYKLYNFSLENYHLSVSVIDNKTIDFWWV
ncbi:4'-phosphopantetheinyl transferase family protein [Pedobacter sp.]|uniref:4'-phosphopantetheinyl transferase family protein n=1 Tax=Pedobacter sp. TaxID=1411316 RepID=UPI003BA8BD0E